jgi:hypothetical protein
VDHFAFGNQKMVLNFIPDGKTKRMSKIEHKLDAKTQVKGHAGEGEVKLTGKQKQK